MCFSAPILPWAWFSYTLGDRVAIRFDMILPTGGIIWEVEGRGSGSKGVAYHTDSPTQVEDLGWWVCMICYPLTTTPLTFHLPNNTACDFACLTYYVFGTVQLFPYDKKVDLLNHKFKKQITWQTQWFSSSLELKGVTHLNSPDTK